MDTLISEKKEFSLIEKMHLILTCFIISWFNNGIVVQVLGARSIILFACFVAWFAITCYFDKYYLWNFVKKARWLLIFSVIVLIYSLNLNTFWNKQSYGALYVPIIYSIGLFFSDEKYDGQKKIVLLYFLIECIIVCFKSMYVLNFAPSYSRTITGGGNVDTVYSLVISYASTYAFVILGIFLLNMRGHYEDKYKFLIYAFVILAAITIYMANYATAILLGALFVIYAMISKKKWSMVFAIIACVLAVVLLSPYLAKFLLWISEWDISEHLKTKTYQLAMSLQGKSVNFNTFDDRMHYMSGAWGVFKKAPFVGIYGRNDLMMQYEYLLRDHNVWIDMLAYYGIVRSIPLVVFYIDWYKNTVKNKPEKFSYAVFCASMFCVVCGFFNPINKSIVQLTMFVIIPMFDSVFKKRERPANDLLKRKGFHIKILGDKNEKNNS